MDYNTYVLRRDFRYYTGKVHNGSPVFDTRDQAIELSNTEVLLSIAHIPSLADCILEVVE